LIGGALLSAFVAVWLWTPKDARQAIVRSTTHEAAPSSESVRAPNALHTSAAPHEAQPSSAELPLLPPEQRDTTLRTVRAPVVGCLTVAGLSTANMDPRMHARLRIGPRQEDGKAGIAHFELLHADDAPSVLRACLSQALQRVAIALPPDTKGYVITPPLAGTEAGKQQPLH
jgi:hypothetical protein